MNPIAEQALARAMAKGAIPVPAAAVLPAAPIDPVPVVIAAEVVGHFDRVGYLEGRRHAREIVLAAGVTMLQPGWKAQLLETLRSNAYGKPPSFVRGVFEIIELLQWGGDRG